MWESVTFLNLNALTGSFIFIFELDIIGRMCYFFGYFLIFMYQPPLELVFPSLGVISLPFTLIEKKVEF